MKTSIGFLVLSILITTSATADSDHDKCNLCFRGRTSPECCISMISEFFWGNRIAGSGVRSSKNSYVGGVSLGLMYNLDTCNAVGGALYMGADDDAGRVGLVPRYRRWLNRNLAFDVSVGVLLLGSDNYRRSKFPGFIAEIALSVMEYASMSLLFEMRPYEFTVFDDSDYSSIRRISGTERTLHFVFTGRSYGAPVMLGLLLVAFAASM